MLEALEPPTVKHGTANPADNAQLLTVRWKPLDALEGAKNQWTLPSEMSLPFLCRLRRQTSPR
jgi:hypothetical protein